MTVILSPDANESRWVNEELDYAELQKKPIFGILARGDESDAIPFGYSRLQYNDIRQPDQYAEQMGLLSATIAQYLGVELLSISLRREAQQEAEYRLAEASGVNLARLTPRPLSCLICVSSPTSSSSGTASSVATTSCPEVRPLWHLRPV